MLRIVLGHGDMMIMHGAEIQKCYEVWFALAVFIIQGLIISPLQHAVKPLGKLRFVFTARHIKPANIPDEKTRARAIIDGALPDNINQYLYDGDVNPIALSVLAAADGALAGDNGARSQCGNLSEEAI